MNKSKYAKKIIFWIITWTIMNSFLLVYVAYFVCRYFVTGKGVDEALEMFAGWFYLGIVWISIPTKLKYIYQAGFGRPEIIYTYIYDHLGVFVLLMTYLMLCFGPPLWLWWKKQTVPRACLLAVGATMGNIIYIYIICGKDENGFPVFCAMPTFYLLLGVFNWWRKKYRPDIDLSRYLIWRRPWT